jgi:hypothetical protein
VKTEFYTVVTTKPELEKMWCNWEAYDEDEVFSYRKKLNEIFTLNLYEKTGLKKALTSFNITELEYGTLQTNFTSGGTNSLLNGSSYSAF